MYASPLQRTASAAAAFALVLLLAAALVFGLKVGHVVPAARALLSVDLAPPEAREPMPEKPRQRPASASAPKGSPSPPNLKNQATPIEAPPPPIVFLPPPPIVVAIQAGVGDTRNTGASDRAGPGQGAGGLGDGNGGGGSGGDGYGDGAVVGPRHLRGELSFSDLPDDAVRPGEEAVVGVRYTVGVDGRVSACRVTETSRIPAVDAMACRLIVKRFRFRPARDGAGRPTPADVVETHGWSIPPEPPDEGRRRRG